MATKKKHPGRTLITFLIIILAMAGVLTYGVIRGKAEPAPSLALDLEGGTQLILQPKANAAKNGKRAVTSDDINQAIEVIRQRVDASGVAEAEITAQGTSNILVSLPGNPSKETLDLVRKSAELNFRAVIKSDLGMTRLAKDTLLAQQATAQSKNGKSATGTAVAAPTEKDPVKYAEKKAQEEKGNLDETPANAPKDNSDDAWITGKVLADFYALDCTNQKAREGGDSGDPKKPLVACDLQGQQKYILSPVELEGTRISGADAGMGTSSTGQSTGQWVVNLKLDSQGAKKFEAVSKRLYAYRGQSNVTDLTQATGSHPDKNRFAIVLDGNVVSAPGINSPISGGRAEISGSFTKSSATTLANQLKFGSLPLNFDVQSEDRVSATLGADQLRYGIWAGILGLLLVVVYLIWQYRGLSIVAAGSLVAAGVILYLVLALLSWSMGYRLSLAGVAGVIISIGTTADSFIVYFERIRDEVRDGRPLSVAIEEGWDRAKRTIVTSDMVNILAAAVLYFLAVGGVQGFAFTLGLTTLIDLGIIFLFTHPMMQALLRFKFFAEGHKLSGLDPEHLGAQRGTYRYAGAGQVRRVASVYRKKESEPATGKETEESAKTTVTAGESDTREVQK